MTTRHAQQISDNDPNEIKVKFAPEVVRAFARLEAAVQTSGQFDGDVLHFLQDYAADKTLTVRDALVRVALITRETMAYVQKTGDTRAREALDDLTTELMGREDINFKPLKPVRQHTVNR